jgi:hypothetical protein
MHRHNWEHYSARQKFLVKLGELKGKITFEGQISSFVLFLRIGEQVNVGQGTSLGLGRYKPEILLARGIIPHSQNIILSPKNIVLSSKIVEIRNQSSLITTTCLGLTTGES